MKLLMPLTLVAAMTASAAWSETADTPGLGYLFSAELRERINEFRAERNELRAKFREESQDMTDQERIALRREFAADLAILRQERHEMHKEFAARAAAGNNRPAWAGLGNRPANGESGPALPDSETASAGGVANGNNGNGNAGKGGQGHGGKGGNGKGKGRP